MTGPASPNPTGSVQIQVDSGALSSAQTLASGQFTFSNVNLGAVGSHTVTVYYGGDTGYNSNSQTTTPITVAQAGTTVTLSASPAEPPTAAFGQAVTFTATVHTALPSLAALPSSGTITFFDGGTQIGLPQAINGSGMATIVDSNLTVATHTITATYNGDGVAYAASPVATLAPNYVVAQTSSVTTVTRQLVQQTDEPRLWSTGNPVRPRHGHRCQRHRVANNRNGKLLRQRRADRRRPGH